MCSIPVFQLYSFTSRRNGKLCIWFNLHNQQMASFQWCCISQLKNYALFLCPGLRWRIWSWNNRFWRACSHSLQIFTQHLINTITMLRAFCTFFKFQILFHSNQCIWEIFSKISNFFPTNQKPMWSSLSMDKSTRHNFRISQQTT